MVEAASRQRISPSALMKMRWVVTFKDDGSLKARLVVQGFTDQRLGKIPTSSPTASRRSRQIFLTLAASLGFQTHKGDVKCAFLQGDLDEQHVDDNDDDDCKNESAQPVSDTFCEPVPELSRKLQLEHHQCVRLLKAVCGLGQRSKKMVSSCCQRSSKHERRRISHGTLLVDFPRRKRRHSCSVLYVDDFMLACSDSPFGKHIFDSINNLHEWGTWESRVFTQCGARITHAYDKHTRAWGGFEISFAEYVKEISMITLPSHRRRDKKSQITPLELSQLRALHGQLLWLGMQCLPQLLAPRSLLMGQTPIATSDTIYEVNKLARKATVWARMPLKVHVHHSPVVTTYTDVGWAIR